MRLVFTDQLKPGMVTACDVKADAAGIKAPLLCKNSCLNQPMIRKLIDNGIRFIYVHDSFGAYGKESPQIQIDPVNLVVVDVKPIIGEQLREEAIESLQSLFDSVVSGDIHESSQIVRHLDTVVEQLVEALDQHSLVNIGGLKDYDEYTYHHSLSVAVLSIAIGQHFNYGKEELSRLGKCAIMHDIGKTAVPIEIIHKTSRLDDTEFSIVKRHSVAGYEYLVKGNIGDSEMWAGVLGHHEKVDGTGYPNRLSGEQIPIWSRIISVADVYDALTSNRPYRVPMQPFEAVEYIMGGIDSFFDYDVVSAFVKKVDLYPEGSIVELSNDRLALVINSNGHMRPVVRDLATGSIYDLAGDMKLRNIVVKKVLSHDEALQINPLSLL